MLAGTLGLLATAAYPLSPAGESTSCSGAAEVVLAHVMRLLPRVPVGYLLNGFNAGLILLAFALFGRLLYQVSGSALFALAAVIAVAWSPAAPPTLAPAINMAALAAVSWTLLAVQANDRGTSRETITTAGTVIGGCALLVLALPAFLLPLTVVTAAYLWQERAGISRRFAILAAVGWTAVAAFAVLAATPSAWSGSSLGTSVAAGLACVVPGVSAAALATWLPALRETISAVGPLPFALAAAGFASALWRTDYRLLIALTCGAAAALVATGGLAAGPSDLLMPLVVAFWCLVVIGARAVVDWSPGPRTQTVLAWLLIILVPLLQLSHRLSPTIPTPAAASRVAQLSTNEFWYLIRALPDGAIVREDRTTDMLFRAVAARLRRAGRTLRIIPADTGAVRAALRSGPVYALPLSQADLRNLGFVLRADGSPAGVAEVVESWPCVELSGAWQVAKELTRTTRFALISDGPADRGPVVIILASEQPPDAWPLYWPARTTRGFRSQTYDLARDSTVRGRLQGDGVSPEILGDSPYILRLVLWRTPDAPLMLPVALRDRPTAVLASLAPEAEGSGLRLCPIPDGP